MTKATFRNIGAAFLAHCFNGRTLLLMIFILWAFFSLMGYAGSSVYSGGFFMELIPVLMMLCVMPAELLCNRYHIGFGSSRRANWLGLQLYKLAFAVFLLCIFVLNALIEKNTAYLSGSSLVLTLLQLIALSSLGELLGITIVRLGKVGMVLYIIFCAMIGGLAGLVSVFTMETEEAAMPLLTMLNNGAAEKIGNLPMMLLYLVCILLLSTCAYLLKRRNNL